MGRVDDGSDAHGERGIGPPEVWNETENATCCDDAATDPLAHQLVGGGSPEEGGP